MKHIKNIILTFFILSIQSVWAQTSYTTVTSLGDKLVFAGVKETQKGMEMNSHLLKVQADNLSSEKISLPDELSNREIVALLPSDSSKIVMVTQLTHEQGDQPLIHSYDVKQKKWEKITSVDCVSFAKLKVSVDSLEFSCESTDAKGNAKVVQKKVPLKGQKLSAGEISLPMTKVNKESLKAELLGDDFEWDKMKVTRKGKEKVFSP